MPLEENELSEYALRLGKQIRSLRKAAKLTQSQLAESANINAKFLGEVERGRTTLTVSRLLQIAAALNISINKLLEPVTMEKSPIPKDTLLTLLHSDLKNLSEQELFVLYRITTFVKHDKILR